MRANGFGGRVDRIEAGLFIGRRGGLERLAQAFSMSPSAHRCAMWTLHAHPEWVAAQRGVTAYEKQDVERGLARMSGAELRDYALRIGEGLVDDLERHERDDPACVRCRGNKPIREVTG